MTVRQQNYWNIQYVYMQSSPYLKRIMYGLAFYAIRKVEKDGGCCVVGEEPVPGIQQFQDIFVNGIESGMKRFEIGSGWHLSRRS
jgi:hypothetical protein